MKTVYLVRHCEYANPRKIMPGRLPLELSSEGIERAHRLKEFFKDKEIEKIYSSAVKRCMQTAEIIADKNIPITNDIRILESLDVSQGMLLPEPNDWNFVYAHTKKLGGESLQDVYDRMAEFWKKVILVELGNCIVCSHGDPLALLRAFLTQTSFGASNVISSYDSEYPPKGSIRPVVISPDGSYTIEPLIKV